MLKNENSCHWELEVDLCCWRVLKGGTLKEAPEVLHKLFSTKNSFVLFLKRKVSNGVAY